jgi:hypothetical protein
MSETRAEYVTTETVEGNYPLMCKVLNVFGLKKLGLLVALITEICADPRYGRVDIVIQDGKICHIDAVKQYK